MTYNTNFDLPRDGARAMWRWILISLFVVIIGGTFKSVSTYDTLNRLSTKAAPSEATVTNTYDLAGHLVSASDTSAAMQAPTTSGTLSIITAAYDALNHLISKIWSPVQAQVNLAFLVDCKFHQPTFKLFEGSEYVDRSDEYN